jgi:hypothetical protein
MNPLSLILGGAGALAGAFGNKSRTSTAKSNSQYSNQQSGTSQRILLDEQQQMIPLYTSLMQKRLLDPEAGLQPIGDAMKNNVNASFSRMPDLIRKKFGRTGASGKAGMASRMAETARLGKLSDTEAQYWQMVLGQQEQGAQGALNFLGQNFGQQQTGYSSGTQSGTQESTMPSSMLEGGFGGGLNGLLGGMKLKGLFGRS